MASIVSIPNWLRWVLIPFVSVLTFFAVAILGNLIAKVLVFIHGGLSGNFFDYIIVPSFAGYYAVASTALIAPGGKQATALVMGSLWIMACGFGVFFALLSGEFKLLLPAMVIACAGGYAALTVEEEAVYYTEGLGDSQEPVDDGPK